MIAAQPLAEVVAFILFGLAFGSLATALSHRLPQGLPIANDRSRCPKCDKVLGPLDLFPVLSWLVFRGRCRHCGQAISWRYPAIELVVAALFAAAWWHFGGETVPAAILALTAFGLTVITVADLEAGIIPDAILLFLAPLAVVWRWMDDGGWWWDAAAGALAGAGVSFGLRWAFRRWRGRDGLGLGDVKFLGMAGLFVGLRDLGAYLLLSGALGLVLGLAWRLAGRGPVFPFGPALCAALLLGLFHPEIFLWLGPG